MILWILLGLLVLVLVALVVDRRLHQARRKREEWLMAQAFERAAATPPQRLREMADAVQTSIDRGESIQQFRERARGGSSWSSSSDSGSSSCDSSSSSGGGE